MPRSVVYRIFALLTRLSPQAKLQSLQRHCDGHSIPIRQTAQEGLRATVTGFFFQEKESMGTGFSRGNPSYCETSFGRTYYLQ